MERFVSLPVGPAGPVLVMASRPQFHGFKKGIKARWSGELGSLGGGPGSCVSSPPVAKSCPVKPLVRYHSFRLVPAGEGVGSGFFTGLS